jgi:hypothetical protein
MSDLTPPPPSYGAAPTAPGAVPPPNYLVWSILSTIFCCIPFGIASIVFAAQVNGKFAAGDIAGAEAASKNAKKFAIIAAVAGVIVSILYIIFFVFLAANSEIDTTTTY